MRVESEKCFSVLNFKVRGGGGEVITLGRREVINCKDREGAITFLCCFIVVTFQVLWNFLFFDKKFQKIFRAKAFLNLAFP